MTDPQTNLSITGVRLATAGLMDLAARTDTFHEYVDIALNILKTKWPEISRATLIHSDTTSSRARTLVLETTGSAALIEVPTISKDGWEILRLWGQMVSQIWSNRTRPSSDRVLQLYESLYHIGERLNKEMVNENMLSEVCQIIVEAVDYVGHVGLVMNDYVQHKGTVIAEYPDFGNVGTQLNLRGYRLIEQLQNTLEPIAIDDVTQAQGLLGDNYNTIIGVGIKAMLVLPIVVQKSLVASIGLDVTSGPHQWTREEVEVLRSIATQLSLGMYNAELFEEISSRIVSEALTTRVTERLPLRSDINTLLQTAARELGLILGARQARIVLNTDIAEPTLGDWGSKDV